MKLPILSISGLILGSFMAGALVLNPDQSPPDSLEANPDQKVTAPISPPARSTAPITISEAKAMFQAYHQSADITTSKGLLKRGDGSAIESYFLDYEKVIKPLKTAIESENKTFFGICAIPVKNPDTGDHTLMFMGLVQKGDSAVQDLELYIPPADSAGRPAFIYDYTNSCPDECAGNHEILWGN